MIRIIDQNFKRHDLFHCYNKWKRPVIAVLTNAGAKKVKEWRHISLLMYIYKYI